MSDLLAAQVIQNSLPCETAHNPKVCLVLLVRQLRRVCGCACCVPLCLALNAHPRRLLLTILKVASTLNTPTHTEKNRLKNLATPTLSLSQHAQGWRGRASGCRRSSRSHGRSPHCGDRGDPVTTPCAYLQHTHARIFQPQFGSIRSTFPHPISSLRRSRSKTTTVDHLLCVCVCVWTL
jgi:hypothetical protein